MAKPETGSRVVFKEGHPHSGAAGTVVGYHAVDLWPELGPMPVVKVDNGPLCMITDLLKDWRYDLRVTAAPGGLLSAREERR